VGGGDFDFYMAWCNFIKIKKLGQKIASNNNIIFTLPFSYFDIDLLIYLLFLSSCLNILLVRAEVKKSLIITSDKVREVDQNLFIRSRMSNKNCSTLTLIRDYCGLTFYPAIFCMDAWHASKLIH
jgi:hypothetical protein